MMHRDECSAPQRGENTFYLKDNHLKDEYDCTHFVVKFTARNVMLSVTSGFFKFYFLFRHIFLLNTLPVC